MEKQIRTSEEILQTIKAARDSVFVVTTIIQELSDGSPATKAKYNSLDRNVKHLKIIVADSEIIESGEDISDLTAAIETGTAKLAESIWPTE
jgi:Flp pilus assembly CpaE family ATPase